EGCSWRSPTRCSRSARASTRPADRRSVGLTTLGRVAVYLVFALAAYAAVGAVVAGLRRDRRVMRSVQNAFAAALLAIVALEYGLVTNDFSLNVVFEHTSRKLPLVYKMTSLWASQEGS